MSIEMDFENLLVIRVVVELNLKKFGVRWFENFRDWILWNGRNMLMWTIK